VPAGRLGTSTEIATAALFLACTDASFVTGAELFVDGSTAQVQDTHPAYFERSR